jgi:iron-sulfur cluster repair protein YtfE (RIC family)
MSPDEVVALRTKTLRSLAILRAYDVNYCPGSGVTVPSSIEELERRLDALREGLPQ